jgi:hypothetical protein
MIHFKNITYQKRLKWLFIAFILVFWMCYKFAIKKTIIEFNKSRENDSQIIKPASETNSLMLTNQRLQHIISKYEVDTNKLQNDLLAFVTNFCYDNQLKLKDFKPMGVIQKNDFNILTRMICVEGNFVNCLHLIYALEVLEKIGRVSSVLYKSYVDGQEKNMNLICTIYIQNII